MGRTTMRVDPHVHSEASYDGRDPPELLLEQAATIGLDAIVITDHDRIGASVRAANLAPEFGLVGIPGVELSTAAGHLLGIGIESCPPAGQPLVDSVRWIREAGGAAVVPHPFQRTRHGARGKQIAAAEPDGIETYNAWLFTGYRNRRAASFARRDGYTALAGSDAHSVATVGRAFTELTVSNQADRLGSSDVVTAIRDGATRIEGRRVPFHRAGAHYLKGAGRKGIYTLRRLGAGISSVR